MAQVVTSEEVRLALHLDPGYPDTLLSSYADEASSFLELRTGRDWSNDKPINTMAKNCAFCYIKMQHAEDSGSSYKQDYDYSFGINSMLNDLKDLISLGKVK